MFIKKLISFLAVLAVILVNTACPSRGDEAVSKEILENGLTVLAKRSHASGLATVHIQIRAGSAAEAAHTGSGISHFVEHMVFKGTKARKAGEIEREVKSYGGIMNGYTSQDITGFYITVPSEHLKNALSVLRDMLLNASFDPAEFKKERDVILKEIILGDDEPSQKLIKTLYETSYLTHPYKYPVIGYRKLFTALTRDDLINYYNRMYVPNRTVIGVIGDLDPEAMRSAVREEFKGFRAPNYGLDWIAPPEPVQIVRRNLTVDAPVNLSYLAVGFHSTSVLSKDLYAMDLLAMILGRGDESRLNRSLFKEKRLVHTIYAWNHTPADPGLFIISALLDSSNVEAAEKAISSEIERIKSGEIDERELEAAKRMVASDLIFSRQTIEGQAMDMARDEILTGSHNFSDLYVGGVKGVTKEEIKRMAAAYLTQENSTVVCLMPKSPGQLESPLQPEPVREDKIIKEVLPNGLRLLLRENKGSETVSITACFLGGISAEDIKDNGISNLTARMLLRGTKTRKENEITGAIERRGGNVEPFSGFNSSGINISVLKDDLYLALDILADMLLNPSFPEGELAREKGLLYAMIKDEDDDIFKSGANAFREELFSGHPYGFRTLGDNESIGRIGRADIIKFYEAHCIPENLVISISGDIESQAAGARVKEMFKNMRANAKPSLNTTPSELYQAKKVRLEMERGQGLIMIGFRTAGNDNPDRYPLGILSSVMSGSSGRLFSRIRDKMSLAYTLGCSSRQAIGAGYVVFYLATSQEKLDEARKALLAELKNISTVKPSEEEVSFAKREMTTDYRINAETNGFFSSTGGLDELYGLGCDNLYRYESEIEKVTADDILRVAQRYIDLEASAEVIISQKR